MELPPNNLSVRDDIDNSVSHSPRYTYSLMTRMWHALNDAFKSNQETGYKDGLSYSEFYDINFLASDILELGSFVENGGKFPREELQMTLGYFSSVINVSVEKGRISESLYDQLSTSILKIVDEYELTLIEAPKKVRITEPLEMSETEFNKMWAQNELAMKNID